MKTSTGRKLAIAPLLMLLLAGSSFPVGSATIAPPTTPQRSSCATISNATLAANVRTALEKAFSPRVMSQVQVSVKNRIVTLRGTATFKGTRTYLAKVAGKVKCVKGVINRIVYRPPVEDCDRGQQNCCCPESGCECFPGPACPICGNPPPKPTPTP